MSLLDVRIKNEYRSLIDNVVSDFYEPVLQESILYQRAVGFFSSSALIAMSKGLEGLIKNGGKIQIIASPRLSPDDIEEINKGYEIRKIIERALLRDLDNPISQDDINRLSYIASLIAEGVLDIKIAFLSSNNKNAMYHEKMGLMSDEEGNVVAFSGSMNESENAFISNYESFDVFCSWTSDKERVFQKQMAFRAIWEDYEPGIQTIEFPEVAKNKLYTFNPKLAQQSVSSHKEEAEKNRAAMYLPDDFKIRPYQEEAIRNWRGNGYRGIYDMATGTGKTLTALASVEQLFRDNDKRLGVIIVCPYQHLVEQWVEDIVRFGIKPIVGYSSSSQKHWKRNLAQAVRSFNLHVSDFFCFITTNASFVTKNIQDQVLLLSKDVVYVVDEAHNMGAVNYRKCLPENICFRLGLSATIDRHNDEAGTAALTNYFGAKCITYSLKDAIDNQMLTRYYYYPVLTYLDQDELAEYLSITGQLAKAIRKKNGRVVLSEYAKQMLIKRARVVAGAKGKLPELEKQIIPYIEDNHILIYCGATTVKDDDDDPDFGRRQIDLVADLLGNTLNMRVGRFTSQESAREREQIRAAFAEGHDLQALVAIKCLDEGVNIPSIKTAFILASSTNPKEYIQRRGRVLRKFPGKEYAIIYDFITLPFPVESLSLQNQAVIQSAKGLIKRELIRMMDFAEIAENPSLTYDLIYELKHGFNITEDELVGEEVNSDVI